jgi:prepilin-type N-terminal cleavage/methylation domain-containing protein
MKNIGKKAFTLVELLVVITILAIISVVAYQSFWWAVNKANSGRKVSDVSTLESSLQNYKSDNNYYPTVDIFDANTNLWWYNSSKTATASNKIQVIYNWAAISSLSGTTSIWWWMIYWSWANSPVWLWNVQIWAKWTISINNLWKKYLSKDLYDPEIWDTKVWTGKMMDYWVWRYVYSVYKASTSGTWWVSNKSWTNYNIAYTVKKDWTETYITKIVWDYDKNSCSDNSLCPDTLIWSNADYLRDWSSQSWATTLTNYWIPYWVADLWI